MNSPLRQYRRYPAVDLSRYRKFVVAGRHVGWVAPGIAKQAKAETRIFKVDSTSVGLAESLTTPEARSQAIADVLDRWREKGLVPGWRNELYPVNRRFGEPPVMLIERAAAPLFGILSYGVNIHGLTRADGVACAWVARRSAKKQVDPGKLDVMVGGGQPHDLSIARNVIKECAEEAGVPQSVAALARSVGLITLLIEAHEGLRVGLQFNFDLELPETFRPRNADGEVDGFELWPMTRMLESLSGEDEFMYDVALANIDLLIRSGAIGPERADFLTLIDGLRRPIPFEAP